MTINYPQLSPDQFAARRKRLMESMPNGATILTAGHSVVRNHDVDYEFRQKSTFWYITGFEEPDAVAILRPGASEPYVLFVNPFDPAYEVWVGTRAGVDGVTEIGVDKAFSLEELDEKLTELLEGIETLHYSLGSDTKMDELIMKLTTNRRLTGQRDGKYIKEIIDPEPTIGQMRLIKTSQEIKAIESAIEVTAKGFEAAVQTAAPGVYEYEVQSALENEFRRLGSIRNGYPSIVASGEKACILHYVTNRRQMLDGDLILIDAGAEVHSYTADITRTWPVNGRFTPEQQAVYSIVLEAQEHAIAEVAPGVTIRDIHNKALRVIAKGLVELGVLHESVDSIIEEGKYMPFYMHGTSHWLGLDVHDTGAYKQDDEPSPLQEGMVLTVEPGIYFGHQATDTPAHFRGIGIRIEDNVLVTSSGALNLSDSIPKYSAS